MNADHIGISLTLGSDQSYHHMSVTIWDIDKNGNGIIQHPWSNRFLSLKWDGKSSNAYLDGIPVKIIGYKTLQKGNLL